MFSSARRSLTFVARGFGDGSGDARPQVRIDGNKKMTKEDARATQEG